MKQNKIPRNEYIRKPVGKTNPYKEDTIYTDMGQWKYPGQVTKIPSGDITMQGVPYPVYGQDNLGYSQMMYPGMDYQFPGQYVTEYPQMAKNGGGLLNKTLTCPKCGWSWKAVDGGKDITTCHKCGSTVKLAYGGDPSLANIEGHYPFGGQNTKTHTHMQAGGSWGTPEQMYNDSLNLYNAYQFQKANAIETAESKAQVGKTDPITGQKYSVKGRTFDHRKDPFFKDQWAWKTRKGDDYKTAEELERGYPGMNNKLIANYYNKLKFTGDTYTGLHSSPDLFHKYIQPVATYYDGIAESPVYKKPVYDPSKQTPKALPNKKEEAATISADYLPMIQAGMPEMVSREAEIIASPTPRPSSTNNRISWRMDPETRKMVPVYLEGKTQKVKEGKRLYNKYIPSSTAAIPADFVPQFEPDGNKQIVSKEYGGWLDNLTKAQEGIENIPYMGIRVPLSQEGFQDQQRFKKKPFDENLLIRQQFKESTFRPNVVSRAGARGLAQIKPDVQSDAIKAGVIKEGDDIFDPKVNKKVQEWYMNNLYDSSFINKDGSDDQDSVKMAKSLAAYNWGRGNLLKYLNKEKEKGTDIYKSYDWLKNLPKETHDYVNKILLKKDPKFEAEFSKMVEDYQYRRGGQRKRRGTSKNIQSNINDVFRRNYDVFGPRGKYFYNPNAFKTGGWLDKYNNF